MGFIGKVSFAVLLPVEDQPQKTQFSPLVWVHGMSQHVAPPTLRSKIFLRSSIVHLDDWEELRWKLICFLSAIVPGMSGFARENNMKLDLLINPR